MNELLAPLLRWLPSGGFFFSLPFWACLAVVVFAYRLCPPRQWARGALLLLLNVGMLLTLPRFGPSMLCILFGVTVATYGIGAALNRQGVLKNVGTRRLVATMGILGVLGILAFFKYQPVQQALMRPWRGGGSPATDFIFLIGVSYSSFKAMHFVIESYKQTVKSAGFLSYLNYILFFPAFISGPISRYNHFYENTSIARDSTVRGDMAVGLERIVHGLFKKTVLAAIVSPYALSNLGVPVLELTPWQTVGGLYAFALYAYFDFSGYTDLAIGSARLMGFVLPENFNAPFLKRNIQQFWANWHISLTSWLTDYIYWPLVRRFRNNDFFRVHPILLSNTAIVATFVACGIWHGETVNFLLWGLYHGIGIATVNTYQNWKRKIRHPVARKYFTSRISIALGVLMTFNFVALGMLPFTMDTQKMYVLLGRLFN